MVHSDFSLNTSRKALPLQMLKLDDNNLVEAGMSGTLLVTKLGRATAAITKG